MFKVKLVILNAALQESAKTKHYFIIKTESSCSLLRNHAELCYAVHLVLKIRPLRFVKAVENTPVSAAISCITC